MFNIKEGIKAVVEKEVTKKDTAAEFGSGTIYVYATPMMIGLMENAALKSVDDKLGNDYSTVGINVNINHLAATPVGYKVKAEAVLKKIEGKKLYFDVVAYDEDKKIGEGTHIRYIVNSEKFIKECKK